MVGRQHGRGRSPRLNEGSQQPILQLQFPRPVFHLPLMLAVGSPLFFIPHVGLFLSLLLLPRVLSLDGIEQR
jgi:hypothetical protein